MTLNQAEIHLLKSEYGQARSIYTQIIQTSSPEEIVFLYIISLHNIAQIDIQIGSAAEDVYQKLNQAKDLYKSYHAPEGITFCDMLWADAELMQEKFDLAKAKFQECLLLTWGTHNETTLFCLERFADIRAWPNSQWPSKWSVIYCASAYKSREKLALHKALLFLGDVCIRDRDEETATNLYIVALEGFTYMDVHRSRAQCMVRLGDLAEGQGHTSKAVAYRKAAQPLFEQSLQVKDVAEITARLLGVEKAHQNILLQLANLHVPIHWVNKDISEIGEAEERIHEDSKDEELLCTM
jgi:tetratricopeptide (TPR) repeat protein